MERGLALRIQERALGGAVPEQVTRRTKTAQLAALGWRLVPIPEFWAAKEAWRDGQGNGNAAFVDFRNCHDWLVISPDDSGLMATKIEGRVRAIRWAYEQAARYMPEARS
jgi:hypothetical protein